MRLLTFILVVSPIVAQAGPVQLACTHDTGQSVVVTVDLGARWVSWGAITLDIVTDAPDYLTAMRSHSQSPGSMTWVLDKATGQFETAVVALSCTDGAACTSTRLTAYAQHGTCREALF